MQETAAATYHKQIKFNTALLQQLQKRRSALGWWRLLVFVVMVALSYKVFVAFGSIGVVVIIAGLGVLLYLVSLDVNNNAKIKNTRTLIQINEEELLVLQHQYLHRFDGAVFAPPEHAYANDLDIFGKASLFQYANRCYSEQGMALLAQNLLHPQPTGTIILRHEAVKEITQRLKWRQQLQAFAMQKGITTAAQQKTENWLQQELSHFSGSFWKWFVGLYSVFTLATAMATVLGYLALPVFSFFYLVYFIVAVALSRSALAGYLQLSGIVKQISTLHVLVNWIEAEKFSSTLLNQLQQHSKTGSERAAVQIKQLQLILDRFDMRLSIVGALLLNPFLLWDVRQMLDLKKWQTKNVGKVAHWFQMVAEVEVLNSLSTLYFNNPAWCFPKFNATDFTFIAADLGHPLLPDHQRVTSSFQLCGHPKIALVTGSNMAGKSTFLRSLGLSAVMAQMGAPVCASQLTLSTVKLMSSMRIADNLAENTSTFYAELKKLKAIIEAVNRHERVFILLDEILRGTNSLDRHTGSKALIKQLIKEDAVGVIATHDVELAALQQQFSAAIENYHFDVQVKGEELFFDYSLKNGVCKSLNASILMKKIGIQLSE